MTEEEIIRNAIAEHGRPFWISSVPMSLIRRVGKEKVNQILLESNKVSVIHKSDSYGIIEKWCKNNPNTQTTVYEICEICEMTAPTVRKFMTDRVDLFRKISRGLYETRDPQNDRLKGN